MLDKLKFWKHKDEFDKEFDKGLNLPEMEKSVLDIPPEEFGKPISTTQYGRPPFPEREMTTLRETAPNSFLRRDRPDRSK